MPLMRLKFVLPCLVLATTVASVPALSSGVPSVTYGSKRVGHTAQPDSTITGHIQDEKLPAAGH